MKSPGSFSQWRRAGWLILIACSIACNTAAVDSVAVKKLFAKPTRDYSSGPLWVWNDMLTEAQIRETMRDMAHQQVKQVWVHPRPGLMTPYLEKDWFRLWKIALDEAAKLDMNVWIYDENSYPSGFAGGWVPELMPESRGRGLHFKESKTPPQWDEKSIAVYRLAGDTAENVSTKIKSNSISGEGPYLVAEMHRANNSPWHGNRSYVDLLYPGVTEKFLEVTLDPYRREIGAHFGKRVPGSFTDEPELRPAGGLPWTQDLPEQFLKRRGYNLLDHLASITRPVGDWRKVRHNYFQTLNELFIERWAKPYFVYCEKNNLEFTGHYWEHEWPNCGAVPDNMAMYAWQQRPGIDTLMNQYAEHTHAQFGNARAVRELGSIANQFGRKRTICELYGAGGWDLRFEDMKRIADWMAVLGVNTFNQHLSYVTLRGARKRDHPQSFSYHEPWWDSYHVSAAYLERLTVAVTEGQQINRVLVLEPTTTAWMHQGDGARLKELGDSFFNLVMSLEAAQIEYDLGCEDVIARRGSVHLPEFGRKAIFQVGRRHYTTVVLPAHTDNLNGPTFTSLLNFVQNGGTVISLGEAPTRLNGSENPAVKTLAAQKTWIVARPEEAPVVIRKYADTGGFTIARKPDDKGILFHMRRHLEDGELLLLVNTSIDAPSAGTIESPMRGVEQWNLNTGSTAPYRFEANAAGVRAAFELPPSGSLLLFLSKEAIDSAQPTRESSIALTPSGPIEVRRLEPNVLTLDYVDITAGGETRTNLYFYQANQFAWQKNGMDRNPWDSAVQFKDELIAKTFAPESGFEASYKFTIEEAVPKNLAIVIERPDLYLITCNGQRVKSRKGDWWLDKAFGRIPLASAAHVGENVVTIKATRFTMFHELEPAYVFGDFTLRPAQSGFVIAPDEPLYLRSASRATGHSINPEGTMWLSGGVGFEGSADDRAPFVVFDLGQPVDLRTIRIWNYNEGHVRDLTSRGAKSMRITGSANGENFDAAIGTFELPRATGADTMAEVLSVNAPGVRFVRFDFLSNHAGVTYPVAGAAPDNAFVGLAEVQFFALGTSLKDVKVHRCSGELASHRRLARHLVDGSGLGEAWIGWNRQGHPFYAHGVGYSQKFQVEAIEGRHAVSLGAWRGAVAKVLVNGKLAGHIAAPPWECDVTKAMKRGENTIEVVVIGTLKNLLGPHHGSPPLGSAWPGMFQRGPNPGPPPGSQYSNVAYGLFEPFVVKRISGAPSTIAQAREQQ